jgi:hypothetical protein
MHLNARSTLPRNSVNKVVKLFLLAASTARRYLKTLRINLLITDVTTLSYRQL